jgi:drug/metabolite transporter (DMT)-like permease
MDAWNYVLILALVVYAIIRQTQRHEVVGRSRFKLAIIYAGVGVLIGGFNLPRTPWSVTFLAVSLLLSAVVGIVRGRLTRVWREEADGTVYAQGTPVTIGLFVGLILAKFALGTLAYLWDISDDGGVGEVLVMIALMVGLQAQIVWRRARPLGARESSRAPRSAPPEPVAP